MMMVQEKIEQGNNGQLRRMKKGKGKRRRAVSGALFKSVTGMFVAGKLTEKGKCCLVLDRAIGLSPKTGVKQSGKGLEA